MIFVFLLVPFSVPLSSLKFSLWDSFIFMLRFMTRNLILCVSYCECIVSLIFFSTFLSIYNKATDFVCVDFMSHYFANFFLSALRVFLFFVLFW